MRFISYMTIRFQLIGLLMLAISIILAMQLIVQMFMNAYKSIEVEVLQAQVISEIQCILLRQQQLFSRETIISTNSLNMINEIIVQSDQTALNTTLYNNKRPIQQVLSLNITNGATNVSNTTKYYQALVNLEYILPLFISQQPSTLTEHTFMILKDGSSYLFQASGLDNTTSVPFTKANINSHIWFNKYMASVSKKNSNLFYTRQYQVLQSNPYEFATSTALVDKKGQIIGVVAFSTYILYITNTKGVLLYNSNQSSQLIRFSTTNLTGFDDEDWKAIMNNDIKNSTCINSKLDKYICRYNRVSRQDEYILVLYQSDFDVILIITIPKNRFVDLINNQTSYIDDEIENLLVLYIFLIVGGGLLCILIVFILSGCILRRLNNLNQSILLKIKDKFHSERTYKREYQPNQNYVDKLISAYHYLISSNKSSKSTYKRIIESFQYPKQPEEIRQSMKNIRVLAQLAEDAVDMEESSNLILIEIFKGSLVNSSELNELL